MKSQDPGQDLGDMCSNSIHTTLPWFTPASCVSPTSFMPHPLSSSRWVQREHKNCFIDLMQMLCSLSFSTDSYRGNSPKGALSDLGKVPIALWRALGPECLSLMLCYFPASFWFITVAVSSYRKCGRLGGALALASSSLVFEFFLCHFTALWA